MAHDVFICHSSKDRSIATAICSTLEQERIRCWIAPRDVVPGSDYAQSIVEAISGSRLTVLVFSDESNHSTHVRREIERSVSHGIPILPFRVEDVVPSPSLEYFISDAHWLDAVSPPLERHLHHLAGTVRVLLDRERTSQPDGAPLPPPRPGLAAPLDEPPHEPPHVELAPHGPPMSGHGRRWVIAATVAVVGLLLVGLAVVVRSGGGDDETTPASESPELTVAADPTPSTSADDERPSVSSAPAPTTPTEAAPTLPAEPVIPPATTAPTLPAEPVIPPATTVAPDASEELRAPVDALDSFAFTETMSFEWDGGAMTMVGDGTYVAPDRQSCTTTAEMSGFSITSRAVVIGDRAWYDDGFGDGLVEVDPDDQMLNGMLAGCPTSDAMWTGDWSDPPEEGMPVTVDGQELIAYDVSLMESSWYAVFGLPPGVTADTMILYVSPDRTWVAGMEASISGTAETFRTYFGFPPVGIEGDCSMSMTVTIGRPNDATLEVTAPS